ncbi:hypothetical protein [Ammoniphilus sp. CFH 90114]|uniref:hypothetical protein n=1 Tax=Ammoniphilus sp. CFH 90114 TaxID=2493665 RepID=UPI00100DD0E5|nr:hypothetical protein [Ammoniphilus sp. CFH 90114]RXT04495.1 hypothetical protein EIZ39_19945 [Ammoniphilus sp. CFH 90114]
MGLKDFFRKGKLKENSKEVYRKFLLNLSEQPSNEYLRKLTVEAGEQYYGSLRKDGQLTENDRHAINRDINAAVEHKSIFIQ